MNYKRLLLLWLLIVMFSGGAKSQVYTDHIVRNFKLTTKSAVEVSNKYGKVHVRTWDKDSVRFVVKLKIQAANQQKLKKLKDQVSFDFTKSNYYVVAKTEFTKSGGIFSDVVETIVPSNTVTIDYTVYIPATTTLKIHNKFGDVYVDDFQGLLNLSLSNGNLKANHLKGVSSITLHSGDGMVNQLDKGIVTISYSDFEVKQAGSLKLESRSSRIEIGKVEKLNIYSRRDKYYIDELKELTADGYFLTLHVAALKKELNSTMKYGEVSIEKVINSFDLIDITSSYTDIDLLLNKGASYNLDITHHPDVLIKYPTFLKSIQTKELNTSTKTMKTYGLVGNKVKTAAPIIKIVADKKCYINLFHE